MLEKLKAAWQIFKAPKIGGKEVVGAKPLEATNVGGAGAGEPLPAYPLARVNGLPASRAFDFPDNINLNMRTDDFRSVTYRILRWFGDNHLITRAAVNIRKKEIVGLSWDIMDKDEKKPSSDEAKNKLKAFWESPDRRDDFPQWLNRLLEDLFVVDAPCYEVRKTRKGDFYGLDILDGTTIKIILDDTGRVGRQTKDGILQYQPIIRGQPNKNFYEGELVYNPYNNNTRSPYGKSFLEAALLEANTTIRALTMVMSYFTEGTVPPGFVIAAESVKTPEQFIQFQNTLNAVLEGSDKTRNQLLALPFGSDYIPAKETSFQNFTELKNYLDITMLMAFEVQPQEVGLTYQVNKATGEVQENITYRRAIRPIVEYLENMFYRVNRDLLGEPGLRLKFTGLETEDKLLTAQVHGIYSQNRIMTTNEIRAQIGLDPVEGGDSFPEPAPAPTGLFAYNWAEVEKELGRWERKALNGKEGFISDILPSEIIDEVEIGLLEAKTPEAIKECFAIVKKKYQEQNFGRRFPALSKKMSRVSNGRLKISTGNGGQAFLPP